MPYMTAPLYVVGSSECHKEMSKINPSKQTCVSAVGLVRKDG